MKKKNLILTLFALSVLVLVSSCRRKEICAAYDRVGVEEVK